MSRRFWIATLPTVGEATWLDAATSHHLLNVCRHARGSTLVLFDGVGREIDARLDDVTDGRARLSTIGDPRDSRPAHALHLVLGVPKGPALDAAVRMAVEAGATDVHPALSSRSVPRGDHADRWQRIATAAAQQCGRADVPTVHPLAPLPEVLDRLGSDALDRRVAVPGGERLGPAAGPAAVAVGPEGGFSAPELEAFARRGFRPFGLGGFVLRTDTAVAVALSVTAP